MQTKKRAALAGAAATVSGELEGAGDNIVVAVDEDKRISASSQQINGSGNHDHADDEVSNAGQISTIAERILARLGPAVLLPIPRGEKGPRISGWQTKTAAVMTDLAYVAQLNSGGNIGVLLGAASSGLCTIDLDHDEVEPFLTANPKLRGALRTRRARGGNIWVRIQGSYPEAAKIKTTGGESWGEWRADRNQTVIYGEAIDRSKGETKPIKYKIVENGAPADIRFEEIIWPKGLLLPWSRNDRVPEARDHPDAQDESVIILPSGRVSIQECADKTFRKIAPTRTLFQRGGAVTETGEDDDGIVRLSIVSPAAFRSRIESFGRVMAWRSGANGDPVLKPAICPEETAKALIETIEMREHLPRISTLVGCPILIQSSNDSLAVLPKGYHPENGGVLVTGGALPPEVDCDEAVQALCSILEEFDFQTPGDRSRALAQLITPALKLGGFIPGFVPADVAEADQSQSGKTYRQRVTCAIYNEQPRIVARRDGGVGSVDESFAQALISGRPFIQFDNLRGKLDSQFIETFLTAIGGFPARVPHRGEILVDPSRYLLLLTSNGVETTRDMANRSSIIRIRKRSGFAFRVYEEGEDLLGHVRARQPYFLGCVFAIIRRWVEYGKPHTDVREHDFRAWAQPLDWIVQHILDAATLLDGHQGAQDRVSNPALTFLRNVALQVREANRLGECLSAGAIADLCEETGLAIPGLKTDNEDHAKRQIGVQMGRVFRETSTVQVDHFSVTRTEHETQRTDGGGSYHAKFYEFTDINANPQSAQGAQD